MLALIFPERTWRPYPFSAKKREKKKQTLHFFTLRISISRKTPKYVPPSWKEKTEKSKKKPSGMFPVTPFFVYSRSFFSPRKEKGNSIQPNPTFFGQFSTNSKKTLEKDRFAHSPFPHKTRTVGKRGNSCWVESGPKSSEVTPSGV